VLTYATVLFAWGREHSCLEEINRSAVDPPCLGQPTGGAQLLVVPSQPTSFKSHQAN